MRHYNNPKLKAKIASVFAERLFSSIPEEKLVTLEKQHQQVIEAQRIAQELDSQLRDSIHDIIRSKF